MTASESRPMDSKVVSGSSGMSSSSTPIRLIRICCRSASVNCVGINVLLGGDNGRRQLAELLDGRACCERACVKEPVCQPEITPGAWTESGSNDHIGSGGVRCAGIHLHEVHDLQHRLKTPLPTGGLSARLIARPGRQGLLAHEVHSDHQIGAGLAYRVDWHRNQDHTVDETAASLLVGGKRP